MPETAPGPTPEAVADVAEAQIRASAASGPLILFDGVCNLCHAAVSWVIERDRRNVFRFASLQSRAARSALAAAPGGEGAEGARPDSVVLVDGDGVHYRSDAAIRIARGLGFPWSLARLGAVLPRPFRDGLYDWIARNRYRWFGRQNACRVPTPELRSRFLDADEPAPPPDLPSAPISSAPISSAPLGATEGPPSPSAPARERPALSAMGSALLYRFVLVYLFLQVFPFPLGSLPYTGQPATWWMQGTQAGVSWVAKAAFGKTIEFLPSGSGDTTFNYVQVATNLVLALVAALAWTLARRGLPVSERTRDGIQTYVRLFLASVLLTYGWEKAFPLQMPAPGPERLLVPIGETSPMGLLWTFMGASPAYQIFAGLGEVVAGMLLLWRRTAQLGSLVGTAVLTNVVVLNFCYDVPVKIFSSHLLLMSIFLLLPHAARLVTVLLLNLPAQPVPLRPFPFRRTWTRRTAFALKAAFLAWLALAPPYFSHQMRKEYGDLAPPAPLLGTYRVESFQRDGVVGRANEDATRWVRVGLGRYAGTIQRADGRAVRMRFSVGKKKPTVTFTPRDAGAKPATLGYSEPGPGLLRIEGTFEGGKTVVLLRREAEATSLLMTRGFHWINEVPLNR